ncbi:MAG: hypothetical protein LDL37_09930 [Asticcacaulis sp.]|uniref:hypothetical protein n=1 Tax=Asticcacaulis sp. TaxID=1872648 RepID=UPI0025BC4E1B|nr:hypothetical protein [Asticcacaulis sp.]MCA1935763.1 hypothetical protein [Asticcacaulis sp.]
MSIVVNMSEWRKLAQITTDYKKYEALSARNPSHVAMAERRQTVADMIFAVPHSRNRIKIFLKNDTQEIIDFLQSMGCDESEYLRADFWEAFRNRNCGPVYLPKVTIKNPPIHKSRSGHKVRIYMNQAHACFGDCHNGRVCQHTHILNGLSKISVCDCC